MSRARHKTCKASGGKVSMPELVSGNPEVIKEAKSRKKGGRVKMLEMEGKKGKHRMDRPRRASGGKVGANTHPFSTAHKAT